MTAEFILRLFIAVLLGSAIGLEREYRAKEAGIRTHFLVALGSALFMILSQYGFNAVIGELNLAKFDPSRIAAQVVTGIGFIGAGTIILQKHMIRGLTTAAGLWVTAAIGMTCGSGLYLLAAASTIMVLICLEALNIGIQKLGYRSLSISFAASTSEDISRTLEEMRQKGIEIDSYSMQKEEESDKPTYHVSMEIKAKRSMYHTQILSLMKEFGGVTFENIE
ncbi:MgtC/SapB family protein [Prevotella sp. KH2C16]|uniref:MgtC/SapB family protein n=1 Tax=Prevotella sp. KH2C16 TaxID=1855325 RepID=UPI0008E3A6DF|nr:MgtC/SapB family protein [Prevotella sp. KH2C16]SFG65132.1 putative Mg2+ transporter-C (MgtC) family protein [Prevotella sp. KH2C16]